MLDVIARPPQPPAEFPAEDGDGPIGVTPKGHVALALMRWEDAWSELAADERAWFADWLGQLAREAAHG